MYRVLVCCFNSKSVNNIHYGFMEAGCDVENLFIDSDYSGKTDLLVARLLVVIDRFKPDFIFSYGFWDIGIEVDVYLDIIKQKGIFHVYWAYDDPIFLEQISMPIAARSDLVFTTVEECIDEYKKRGVNAFLMLHSCNPTRHKRVRPAEKYSYDIVLLANNYNRYLEHREFDFRRKGINHIIRPLVEDNFNFKVWGLWWTHRESGFVLPDKFYGGVLPTGEESEVYSSAKIALGLQTVGTSRTQFSVRTFEAMGCGIFHLSQYSPALEYFFKKGIHLEWTKSADETLEIVKFYLKKDEARESVALKGQQEVYEKHTLVHRVREMLDIITKALCRRD